MEPFDGLADGTTQQLLSVRRRELSLDASDAAHLVDLYDASVRQTDDELARVFSFLRSQGLMEAVLLVVTSDHGEEFLDHGDVLHGHTVYQELLHVPLLMRGPGVPRGRRVSAPVSLVDVVPTVLGVLESPVPPGVEGVDLAPFWGADGPRQERVLFSHAVNGAEVTLAARERRYKLHYDERSGRHALYDLERIRPNASTSRARERRRPITSSRTSSATGARRPRARRSGSSSPTWPRSFGSSGTSSSHQVRLGRLNSMVLPWSTSSSVSHKWVEPEPETTR